MTSIAKNIAELKTSLPSDVTLVAVSKTKPNQAIMEAYHAGQRIFGENRVQELLTKAEDLPKDIQWHMIGHLQTNKVKYIAPFVSMIHAVDTDKLLFEIDKEAKKHGRVIDVLLQFHIAQEESKHGMTFKEAESLLASDAFKSLLNVNVVGVMGMATFTENEQQIRAEFKQLVHIFEGLKERFFNSESGFKEISMGMSGDYVIAIEEGSTMIRLGSSIFGSRG